jgi:hypothetical protein
MPDAIQRYHDTLPSDQQEICALLAAEIQRALPDAESKVWHGHPVWFLEGNPIVGYSTQKPGLRLMFWSGADFEEAALHVVGKKFKDASVFFTKASEVPVTDLQRWLSKSRTIQWDYENIVRRKGKLERRTIAPN